MSRPFLSVFLLPYLPTIDNFFDMKVYTDNINFAQKLLKKSIAPELIDSKSIKSEFHPLFNRLFGSGNIYFCEVESLPIWTNLFIIQHAALSHYDLVSEFCRDNKPIPDGSLFMAGAGERFHGFKGRAWAGLLGNIHLVAYIEPRQPIEHISVSLTVTSAVSVVQTIDMIKNGDINAGIKWINDILIGDAKVGGVLAFTQAEGDMITAAAIGIGLNVEAVPQIEKSDFVPRAGSIGQFFSDSEAVGLNNVFGNLIIRLGENIQLLLTGNYGRLIELYRSRSVIIGRQVEIRPDTNDLEEGNIYSGRVITIGDDLGLYLEGVPESVLSGRLVLLR
ncbi:MAG TPA: hypothetical protein ENH25_02170 [candidate division Zixibacteria bacterium]|nr:hypothetical protein [candidate division Zixibacteria bacterium]